MHEIYISVDMHNEVVLNTQKRISIFKALNEQENDENLLELIGLLI